MGGRVSASSSISSVGGMVELPSSAYAPGLHSVPPPAPRGPTPSVTVADLALLQPAHVFPLEFFEHAELAVSSYLGEVPLAASAAFYGGGGGGGLGGEENASGGQSGVFCPDWGAARWHATQALALRPGDGPLLHLLRVMADVGEGPEGGAPREWPGFHSLQAK